MATVCGDSLSSYLPWGCFHSRCIVICMGGNLAMNHDRSCHGRKKLCDDATRPEICSKSWCQSKPQASVEESQKRHPRHKVGAPRLANSQERHCNGTQLITTEEFNGLSRDCSIDRNRKFACARKDPGRHAEVEMRRRRLSDFKAGAVYIQSHFYSGGLRSVLRCCNHGRLA